MINKMKIEVNNALDSTEFSSVGANNSKESVQQLKDKSHVINESNKELVIAIDKFITNIKQIKSIVAGIVDISEQTDLLALNASIESSRAGEVGKGFAVVASQIRGLADENAKLTDNIYKLIEVLEKNTIRVRKVVDEVISSVEEENETIDNTYAYIENMGNNIRGLSSNINSILKKIEMINEYSKDIEEQSSDLVESSNLVKDRTQNAVQLNKDNKTKTEKTKGLMDELVKEVKELDMYI
jgi:methyl-accepting chemotaxis protein